jgi:hypothetical protein
LSINISDSGNLYYWHSNPKDVALQVHLGNFFDIKSLEWYISVIKIVKFVEGILYSLEAFNVI